MPIALEWAKCVNGLWVLVQMFAIISLSMAAVTFLEIKWLDRRGLAARAYLSILNGIWFFVMALLMEVSPCSISIVAEQCVGGSTDGA